MLSVTLQHWKNIKTIESESFGKTRRKFCCFSSWKCILIDLISKLYQSWLIQVILEPWFWSKKSLCCLLLLRLVVVFVSGIFLFLAKQLIYLTKFVCFAFSCFFPSLFLSINMSRPIVGETIPKCFFFFVGSVHDVSSKVEALGMWAEQSSFTWSCMNTFYLGWR